MIVFERLDITAINTSNVVLSWAVEPTNEDLSVIEFQVERSISQEGPFELIGQITDQFYFIDHNASHLSKWSDYFYRIKLTDSTGREVLSPVNSLDAGALSPRALYIIRAKSMVFRHIKGRDTLVYKRRQDGARCPECYDPIEEQVTQSDCPVCMGTGFLGGYYPPIRIQAHYMPVTARNRVGQELREIGYTQVDMMNFPLVVPRDVLYEVGKSNWWLINSVTPTEDQRMVVSQMLECRQIDPTRVETNLPMPTPADSEGLQLVI